MSEKMPLEEIAREVAEERYHLALVRCWHHFRHDNNPEFRRAEEQALTDLLAYENHKEELGKVFASGESLRILNFGLDYPLAILEVLDQLLWERHHATGKMPRKPVSIDGKDYLIHRRPLAHAAHARYVRQRGHLQRWLRHHWIVPADVDGYRIHLKPAAFTQASFDRCLEAGVLRVFVTGFADGVAPVWTRAPSGGMTAKGLDNPKKRRLSVRKALKEAMKAGADIVVFPELTLCPVLCDEVSLWLEETEEHPFIAVLPGSFHRERAGELRNYAELFSRTGSGRFSPASASALWRRSPMAGSPWMSGAATGPAGGGSSPLATSTPMNEASFALSGTPKTSPGWPRTPIKRTNERGRDITRKPCTLHTKVPYPRPVQKAILTLGDICGHYKRHKWRTKP